MRLLRLLHGRRSIKTIRQQQQQQQSTYSTPAGSFAIFAGCFLENSFLQNHIMRVQLCYHCSMAGAAAVISSFPLLSTGFLLVSSNANHNSPPSSPSSPSIIAKRRSSSLSFSSSTKKNKDDNDGHNVIDDDDDDDDEKNNNINIADLPYSSTYHAPVMWKECIEGLLSCERGQQQLQQQIRDEPLIFVDGTLGGGGHSEALLQQLQPGDVVFGCDVDPDALKEASNRLEKYTGRQANQFPLFVPVHSNFAQLLKILPTIPYPAATAAAAATEIKSENDNHNRKTILNGLHSVDGILLDLGVSSHQIDTPERGFAFMADGPLDMRMMAGTNNSGDTTNTQDPAATLTAADLCNEMEEYELSRILKEYGDEPRAKKIAKSIIKHRPVTTTGQLREAVSAVVPAFDKKSKRKGRTATLARVFQALRIVVNREDRVLQQVLEEASPQLLREGGRLVVLSYHSMEDRATKRVMRDGTIVKQRGSPERDIFGNPMGPAKPFKPLGKFRKATKEEVENNSRARSATLRIAERLEVVVAREDDED